MSGKKNNLNVAIIQKTFCCLIILLLGNFLWAQSVVSGTVHNDKGKSISGITVMATEKISEKIKAYTYTDDSGNFSLLLEDNKNYLLSFDGLSFKKKIIEINLDTEKNNIYNISIEEEETVLDEVFLETERAITLKKDTTIYNVDDFTRGNEVVVEDMLKNIPGLEITSDGGIKVGGREVEKVMVDYDDFFNKGYRILTKNMTADAIDKVEVLDKYSNNKLLKGVENSDKVALNLSLKEENRNVWFGNSTLGYGLISKNRYDASANVMSFGKKNKYYFLTSLNNTGKDVSGDMNYVVNPNRFNEPGTLGNNETASSLINLTAQNLGLKPQRTNFNNVELLSLNSIFTLSPKVKVKTLALLKTDENDFFRNTIENFTLNQESFTITEDYQLNKNSLSGMGKIDFTYDISKNATLEYIGKYSNERQENNATLVFNQDLTSEKLKEINHLIDQKVVYTRKFEKNNALVLTGRYKHDQTPQEYRVNRFFYEELFPESNNSNEVFQTLENSMRYAGMEAHYFDRKESGHLIEIKGGYTSRLDKLNSTLFFKSENSSTVPDGYSNNVNYMVNDLYFESKFIYNFKKFLLTAKIDINQYFNRLSFENEVEQKDRPLFINPKLGLDWDINKNHKLSATYSYNSNNASILDVYDSFLLKGYRNFSKGTGSFDQLNATNINLNYRLGNPTDRFFAYTNLSYIKNHDFFSTNSLIRPNFSQTTKVLFKDREMWNANVNADNYVSFISTNIKASAGFSQSNYLNIVNSNLRRVDYYNYNYGIELRSGFNGIFNFNLGSTWQHNTVSAGVENSFTNNTSFLDLIFVVNKNLNFDINAERYFFGNLSNNSNVYNFLDFEGRYTFKKNKLSLSLEGHNLTSTQSFQNISISDISTTRTEIRLLPRFLLLKLDFRF